MVEEGNDMNYLLVNRNSARSYRDGDRSFLQELGDVFVISTEAAAGDFAREEVRAVHTIARTDDDLVLEAAREIHRRHRISGVVTISEAQTLAAAKVREELGLPGMPLRQARLVRDKVAMKSAVGAAGIRVPQHAPLQDWATAVRLLRDHGTVVVKPRTGMGAQGVHFVRDEAQLRSLFAGLSAAATHEVEEFVDGEMFHVDALLENGRVILQSAARYSASNARFRELDSIASMSIDDRDLEDRLFGFNAAVLAALGLESGATHLEVFHTAEGEIVFCEVGARPGGAGIVPAVEQTHGVNLVEGHLRLSLGLSAPAPKETRAFSGWAIMFGKDSVVTALPSLRSGTPDWLVRARYRARVGKCGPVSTNASEGVAEYVFVADTATSLGERAEWLFEHGRVQFADG